MNRLVFVLLPTGFVSILTAVVLFTTEGWFYFISLIISLIIIYAFCEIGE